MRRDTLGNMPIGAGHTWSIDKVMTFLRKLIVNGLISFDTSHAEREIIYQDQNDSSNSSGSLYFRWSFYLHGTQWMQYTVVSGHIGGLTNPCSGEDNVKRVVVIPMDLPCLLGGHHIFV